MEPDEHQPRTFRFDDPRQQRIYRRLLLVGPGPASFYRDVCRLMAGTPLLDSAPHVVAHLVREIESALRDVLEPLTDRSARINRSRALQSDGRESHREEILAVLKALEISESDPVAEAWLRLPGTENYFGLAARAHRDDLRRPRALDEEFGLFWDDMERILDVVLEKFESRYLKSHRLLDELLAREVPTQADAKKLRLHVPNNLVAYGYFFDRLISPSWLKPLSKEGFFTSPPAPDPQHESGGIAFPPWPESRYLARMAALAPETVLEIVLKLPGTENIRIHENLADAALGMPAVLAARVVPQAKVWIESPYQVLLPERLGKLVAHLARGGQVDAALDLARSLLAVLPDPRASEEASGGDTYRLPAVPRARFDTHRYQELLKKNMPELVATSGERGLVLLCDLLDEAITLSRHSSENEGPREFEDLSCIWRPTVEDRGRAGRHGLRDALVTAVRDAAEQLAKDSVRVPALVYLLENRPRPWRVFQRIALHLLRVFPQVASDLVIERLTDRKRFDTPGLRYEYTRLLQEQFGNLSPDDRARIMGWIEKGPDLAEFKVAEKRLTGREPTDEGSIRYAKRWRRDWLARLGSALPAEWRDRYDELVAELGAAEHPELVSRITSWVGPTSPKTTEELQAMTVDDIVAFLRNWRPPGGPMSPSPEGLSRIFSTAVAASSERFAASSGQFRELDPTYVSGLISGLRDAVKQNRVFHWAPVLGLCRWVIEQPREIPGRTGEYADLDPGWVWTRKAIAELLSSGFEPGAAEMPLSLRTSAWELLKELVEDPDPAPETEARDETSNRDPATLSINTTRGEAMHAVVRYALWLRRHLERAPDGKERSSRGFDEMPEVREVLDRHVDQRYDTSRAIRAVYGQWFPWLVLLDRDWATRNVRTIFPAHESLSDMRDAAWDAYIRFCDPYDDAFDILREEYNRAIQRIEQGPSERQHLDDPDHRLAEHLMTLYWRGKLTLDEPEDLLAQFYVKAPDPLRAHSLEFVGRSLHNTNEAIPIPVLDRLQALWQFRLNAARAATSSASHYAELAAFGWWFSSIRFDDAWVSTQLREALRISGWAEPDHMVVERLAALAPSTPGLAVECLGLMVEGDKTGWAVSGWRQSARTILATARQSADEISRREATSLIHRLAARGHLEFQDLLSDESS